jgi:hypothetical protein
MLSVKVSKIRHVWKVSVKLELITSIGDNGKSGKLFSFLFIKLPK